MSFEPVWGPGSRALILGSWPSPKSWQQGFYYSHPQNRFWPLLAALAGEETPRTVPEKKALVLRHGLALWDVLEDCSIQGASDASIKNPVPVDLPALLKKVPIRAVFCNGAASHKLYEALLLPAAGIPAVKLPSTSPANASFSFEKLRQVWGGALGPWLKPGNNG